MFCLLSFKKQWMLFSRCCHSTFDQQWLYVHKCCPCCFTKRWIQFFKFCPTFTKQQIWFSMRSDCTFNKQWINFHMSLFFYQAVYVYVIFHLFSLLSFKTKWMQFSIWCHCPFLKKAEDVVSSVFCSYPAPLIPFFTLINTFFTSNNVIFNTIAQTHFFYTF